MVQKDLQFLPEILGEHDLAMEATQKTFIAVFKHLKDLQRTESFRLLDIPDRSEPMQGGRSEKKQKSLALNISIVKKHIRSRDDEWHPEKSYEQMEMEELMGSLLNKLPDEQRVVIIMKEYEGLKFREISEALEISENTAKSRLYYGLRALKTDDRKK